MAWSDAARAAAAEARRRRSKLRGKGVLYGDPKHVSNLLKRAGKPHPMNGKPGYRPMGGPSGRQEFKTSSVKVTKLAGGGLMFHNSRGGVKFQF